MHSQTLIPGHFSLLCMANKASLELTCCVDLKLPRTHLLAALCLRLRPLVAVYSILTFISCFLATRNADKAKMDTECNAWIIG